MENATLFAALIGVVTGVASSFVTHFFQVRLEKQKKQLESEINRKNEFKKEIAQTVQVIMAMVQEISWVSWEVTKGTAYKSQEYLENYNKTAKEHLGKASAQLALLAATDLSVYNRLREIIQEVYDLDLELANGLVDFVEGKVDKDHFMQMKKKALQVEKALPTKFAEILNTVDES
ncbi:MAG: hypothetical protein AAFN93_13615 [Bacteroidota bacterium]